MNIFGCEAPLGVSIGPGALSRIDSYLESGFTHFEISLPDSLGSRGREEDFLLAAKPLLDHLSAQNRTPWSWHIPFGREWDIAARDEGERQRVAASVCRLISLVSQTGIRVLTIHGCLEPVSESERAIRMAQAISSLREISDCAKARGLSLALENLPRSCLANDGEELTAMLRASGCPGCCFDVNHLLTENHAAFLDRALPFIVTTHLSDYDGINERHWLPGEGIVPFREVVTRLLKNGYKGPLLFELHAAPDGIPYGGREIRESFLSALEK